jgi:RNA-directed DNA polymerase
MPRRWNNLLKLCFADLHKAWSSFIKGKSRSNSIDEFQYSLERNLHEIHQDILNHSYQHGPYKKVVIKEKKRRDLAVAPVRDRVVHRLLYDFLVEKYEKSFDPDVWSCRKGKGLHKCLVRTQKLLKRYNNSYVWRADISKFFDNVNQQTLIECLDRKIGSDETYFGLSKEIIRSYNNNELRTTNYELRTTNYELRTTN